jgi:hypothetical protein
MRKIIVALFCLSLLIIACKHSTTFKEIDISNRYSIQVPAYMHVTDELLPGIASLQYENDSAKVYLLVIDTARAGMREGSLKAFYDSAVSQPALESAQISPAKFMKVDGDSAYTSEMTGSLNGSTADSMKVFYKIEVLASKDRFYQVLMWTRQSKADELKADMEKVLSSFTDIHK